MVFDVIGLLIVVSHVTVIALIILWFGCGKPKSRAQFWAVIKQEIFGIKRPKAELHTKV